MEVGKCELLLVLKFIFNNYIVVLNYCWILLGLNINLVRIYDFINGI